MSEVVPTTNSKGIDGLVALIDVHTLTRESQEVMFMFITVSESLFPNGDADSEIIMVDVDIFFSGQLNITTSTLPDNPGVSSKLKTTRVRVVVCNVSS